jgi:hypothetical protein
MRTDLNYNRENGNIEVRLYAEGSAEEVLFWALQDRNVQPVRVEYNHFRGIKFTLELPKRPKKPTAKTA